jgi:glycosyltransferase involved in cell wall biosynthesis
MKKFYSQVFEDSKLYLENNKIKFCFIVPTYNNQEYILPCLRSIYRQNQQTFRIIVIDDCSIDLTTDIIKQFVTDNNITNLDLIINSKRYGGAYSRFVGIKKTMDEEILLFLDGDDWLFSDNILEILDKIYDDGYTMTVGSYRKYNGKFSIFTNRVCNIDVKSPGRYHLRTALSSIFKNYEYTDILDDKGEPIRYLTDYNETLFALNKNPKIFYCHTPMMIYNIISPKTEELDFIYKKSIFEHIQKKYYLEKDSIN